MNIANANAIVTEIGTVLLSMASLVLTLCITIWFLAEILKMVKHMLAYLAFITWQILYPARLPFILANKSFWGIWGLLKKKRNRRIPTIPSPHPQNVVDPCHIRERGARVSNCTLINEHFQLITEGEPHERLWLAGVSWPPEYLTKLAMVYGLPGSAKSTLQLLVLFQTLYLMELRKDSAKKTRLLLVDPNGAMFAMAAKYTPCDTPFIRLTPQDTNCVRWDIAKDLDTPEMFQVFAKSIFPESLLNKVSDPFWYNMAIKLLKSIYKVFLHRKSDWQFHDLIIPFEYPELLVEILLQCPETVSVVDEDLKGKTGKDIKLTAYSIIQKLVIPAAYWQKAKYSISMKEYLNMPHAVAHIMFTPATHEALGMLVNSMMTVMYTIALERKRGRDNDITYTILDELAMMADIVALDLAFTQGRKSGLGVFVSALSVEALVDKFGEKREKVLSSLTAINLILASSHDTAERFSKLVGTFEGWLQSTSKSETQGNSNSYSNGAGPGGGNWSDTVSYNYSNTVGQTLSIQQRQAVLTSEVTGLPMPQMPKIDEIHGYGFSSTTGLWRFIVEGGIKTIIDLIGPPEDAPKMATRPPSDAKLLPWTEEDCKRLNLRMTPELVSIIRSLN